MIINYIIIIIINLVIFLEGNYEMKTFKNKQEAEKLLKESRNRIDEIDNELFDLIYQRTSLAKDIALSKDYLGMPVYDKSREDIVHQKIDDLCTDLGLDNEIINQIVDMLTNLNKNEQEKILRRNVDGQY